MYDVKNHQVDNLTYKINAYNKRDKAKKYEVDALISKRKPLQKKQFTRLVQLVHVSFKNKKKNQTNNNNNNKEKQLK